MSNKILKSAMFEAQKRELSALPIEENLIDGYSFSREFEEKMKRMIKDTEKSYSYILGYKIKKNAIIVSIVIIALTTTLSVEAIREPMFKFLIEVFEKYSSISLKNDRIHIPIDIQEKYILEYIPKGYEFKSEKIIAGIYERVYVDDIGNEIVFEQYVLSNMNMTIDTEDIEIDEVSISGNKGLIYTNKGITTIMWSDNKYIFSISGGVDREHIVSMAKSMKIKK